MKTKKILTVLLCGALALSALNGCNNSNSESSGSTSSPSGSSSSSGGSSESSSSGESGVTMSANGEYPIVSEKVTYTVMAPQTNYIFDLQTNEYSLWLE